LGRIEGLKIAICGDILNSRVARSNIHLLTTLGVEVRCIAPPTLMPKSLENLGVNCFNSLKDGINNVNAIMLLRLQSERMSGTESPSKREYYRFYGLDEEKLSMAHHDAVIMHPGPMNRGVEIASSLADNEDRSLIKTQVEIGVAIRMATIEAVYNAQK
jgi:aspartate carbamoyltransferase catalytic subunit